MKKLALTLTLAMAVCAAFAEKPFLGWTCTDVAALKAAAADPDVSNCRAAHRIDYELMVAEIEKPDAFQTLKSYEQFIASAFEKYRAASPVFAAQLKSYSPKELVLQYFLARSDRRFFKEIMADKEYTGLAYYEEYYVINGIVTVSEAETKEIIFKHLASYAKRNRTDRFAKAVDRYLAVSMDTEDEVAVKELKKIYRIALPLLTGKADDPWKPIVAKVQLALKARGVEVK